ncbi:cysteine desulfurase-like protein [Nocardioides mangrovicus]|uniref:Cysteine desulfurase-like protein n=1 Tax=Nocardioides mangrovicus TaxID=2478913 RepID=A0A3L8P151_9ACTN|nr:cysteine desulfurase-like protein [Nocardioides mangrovicus]RLV49105.1 cysteine desulfurase-like protein [Nocardioides mangrovicus]
MTYDVARIRSHFPALAAAPGTGAAHFDGPGGSQTPDVVAQAVYDTLTSPLANRGSATPAERNAEAAVVAGRQAMADLLAGDPAGVVFGRSMTQLTMDLARALSAQWEPGDEVLLSRLDHDANVRPWVIAAGRVGAEVRWIDVDPATGELGPVEVTGRTRLVALTGASNLIGTRPDLPAVAALAHEAGALFYVDGVHLTAHAGVDVAGLGADLFACSPYKFFGPHCGVVHGRPELLEQIHPDKLLPSSDAVPERFELGTLPYELLAGTTAAVDFLADLVPGEGTRRERLVASFAALEQHEDRLRERVEQGLLDLGATVWSRAARRTPTLLATWKGRDPQQIRARLAEHGVNAPAGTFYAYEPARRLGLEATGGLRIGLAPYTSEEDVDRLLTGLADALAGRPA